MEQKIAKLEELSDYSDLAASWIESVKGFNSYDRFSKYEDGFDDPERQEHIRKTWDVHTGLAFTKLYKALR